MGREYFQSEVVSTVNLCDNVKHITFKPQREARFEFTPGQFIMIHFPNDEGVELNRSYSIASIPGEDEGYALCVKRVDFGKGSTLLHNLKVGDTIKTSGPFGRFTLRDADPEHLFMVATGTGIAPFRSMRDQIAAEIQKRHVHLLMGVRYPEELLYDDEWRALAAQHDNFTYHAIVSRPRPEDQWDGPVGYVSAFIPELEHHIIPEQTVAYLCGVPEMIDSMRTIFLDKGLNRRVVRTEKFASPPDPKPRADVAKAAANQFKPKFIKKKR